MDNFWLKRRIKDKTKNRFSNESFKKAIIDNNEDEVNTALYCLVTSIFTFFNHLVKYTDLTVEEVVSFCQEKRKKLNQGKEFSPFNYFTTCILGYMRQMKGIKGICDA